MEHKQPKPVFWRYSLRGLLIVLTPMVLCLGWYVNRVHYQQAAVKALQADGFSVYYDYHLVDQAASPPWPAAWLGTDYCCSLVVVQGYHHRDLSILHLERLQQIRSLERLEISINHSDAETFAGIGKLTQLKGLVLSCPPFPVEQLQLLQSLDRLEKISITQPIGDEGIAYLCSFKSLKKVNISSENLSQQGIQQFAKLSTLESLKLRGSLDVSSETQTVLMNSCGVIAIDDGSWKRHLRQAVDLRQLPEQNIPIEIDMNK